MENKIKTTLLIISLIFNFICCCIISGKNVKYQDCEETCAVLSDVIRSHYDRYNDDIINEVNDFMVYVNKDSTELDKYAFCY